MWCSGIHVQLTISQIFHLINEKRFLLFKGLGSFKKKFKIGGNGE
jgi:hypothetical protein